MGKVCKKLYKKLLNLQMMWVGILMKTFYYHVESEKYHQVELGMTRTKIDTTYTTHQFLCLLPFFFFFFLISKKQISYRDQE